MLGPGRSALPGVSAAGLSGAAGRGTAAALGLCPTERCPGCDGDAGGSSAVCRLS